MGQWSRLPANPGAQVQALTRGDSTGLGRLSPRPRCRKAVQPKTINQTFHLKREMAKKERKKEMHSYAHMQMNTSPKNKDLRMCTKPPRARLFIWSSLCPQALFIPGVHSLCYLWHFSLFIYFFFSIPSRFLSIQFTGQFCLFILSRSVSCLCACHRKGPTYYPLGFQLSLPNRCLGPQVGPTF